MGGIYECSSKKNGHGVRVDHRSYVDQGLNKIPTRHLGPVISQMEKRGLKTNAGNINRVIKTANQLQEAMENEKDIENIESWKKVNAVNITWSSLKSTNLGNDIPPDNTNNDSSLRKYWNLLRLDDGVTQFKNRNGTITDAGDHIYLVSNNHELASMAVCELAIEKGWSNIVYEGNNEEYKEVLQQECERQGIEFIGPQKLSQIYEQEFDLYDYVIDHNYVVPRVTNKGPTLGV